MYFSLSNATYREGLTIIPENSISYIMKKASAFCETHKSSSGDLDNACGTLTRDNCNDTSCCVWKSPGKCVAGGIAGPTFNTDKNGKTDMVDYYYFQNKCYGNKCK